MPELTNQQKKDIEQAAKLIGSILQQFKLRLGIDHQITIMPDELLPDALPEVASDAPVSPESAPSEVEVPKVEETPAVVPEVAHDAVLSEPVV